MSNVVFHIELRTQNVASKDHVEAVGKAMERAAGLLHSDVTLILGEEGGGCEIEVYGEDFVNGKFPISLRKPGE